MWSPAPVRTRGRKRAYRRQNSSSPRKASIWKGAVFTSIAPAPQCSLKDASPRKRLPPPVRNPLTGIRRISETRVLDPQPIPCRFSYRVRRALRSHRGKQRVVQRDEFGRRGPPPQGFRGELLPRRDQG